MTATNKKMNSFRRMAEQFIQTGRLLTASDKIVIMAVTETTQEGGSCQTACKKRFARLRLRKTDAQRHAPH